MDCSTLPKLPLIVAHAHLSSKPGAASNESTALLNHLPGRLDYVPSMFRAIPANAVWRWPGYSRCRIVPVVRDFSELLGIPENSRRRRVVYFPVDPSATSSLRDDDLLDHFAQLAGPGGGLILGAGPAQKPPRFRPAYNDASGVTAAFNRNLLVRINRDFWR